ncbi:MAG: A/G-specific adenine glycosylase, partial [Caulobacteraceae bacterium]|nr:A/G-specific adenine glycosylase [Caulobacter sp.]
MAKAPSTAIREPREGRAAAQTDRRAGPIDPKRCACRSGLPRPARGAEEAALLQPETSVTSGSGPEPGLTRLRADLRARLLAWYDRHAADRALPWRVTPAARAVGRRADPYRVWLSEVMLQQTTSAHVAPYYAGFLRRWPTVEALAAAPDAEVMGAWAGLGYYARARNLLACARAVAARGGAFPDDEAGLLALPGCGPYTAAAVAAIAFDRSANVVDGNVERVMARLFAVDTPLPAAKPRLRELAADLADAGRPGDWAQALMDLGATLCRPRTPLCGDCPLADDCAARATGAPERFPVR